MVLNGLKTSSGVYGDEDLAIKRNDQNRSLGQFESEERIVYYTDTSWLTEVNRFFESILNDAAIELGNSTDALKLMLAVDRIYKR